MMTAEENDLLCRVEGDAPMGQLMRRHWIPACMSEEVAERDGTPIRVRLLGEDLVVFRDTDGKLGVLDEYCPHRRASLVLGRNEECGLRCLYHGWKFDVDGNVVEMTSEPSESGFAGKQHDRGEENESEDGGEGEGQRPDDAGFGVGDRGAAEERPRNLGEGEPAEDGGERAEAVRVGRLDGDQGIGAERGQDGEGGPGRA